MIILPYLKIMFQGHGCFFQFCDAVRENVGQHGLITFMSKSSSFMSFMHTMSDVMEVFQHMVKKDNDIMASDDERIRPLKKNIEKFMCYLTRTCIDTEDKDGKYKPGLFKLANWNQFEAVCHDLTRNDNSPEG
jgi:hypothetical protein